MSTPEQQPSRQITEEMGIHREWYIKSKTIKMEELPEFMRHLAEDFQHDYGTICHAIAASGLAAMRGFDRGPSGGITGFQAGAIMWQVIKQWNAFGVSEGEPMWILKASDLLYPQSVERVGTISENTRDWLMRTAKEELAKQDNHVHPNVRKHWEKIAAGQMPVLVRGKE